MTSATSIRRFAVEAPDRPAVLSTWGDRSYAELDGRCNRLVRALAARGLRPGDGVALLCSNRPEFVETVYACQQAGLRLTPVNWHLGPDEVAYIVGDCGAKAFIAEDRFLEAARSAAETARVPARLAVGGPIGGFDDYDQALAREDDGPVEPAPSPGVPMFYTSGTTGRPKGVRRDLATTAAEALARLARMEGGESVALVTGPLYHAAPLTLNLQPPIAVGCTVSLMDAFDAEEFLRLVEAQRVTHTHMVPTMFHRLLALGEDVRSKYDASSLGYVLHGAAPCPVHVKQAMINWLGPVVHEYYASTEGSGTSISAQEWLARPGSVGKPFAQPVEIRDPFGEVLPPGEVGAVWCRAPEPGAFEYFNDDAKTGSTFDDSRQWFTVGDLGYLDDDGYLFLTGRTAEVIISGGVNIYPAEVDAVLLMHDAVGDGAVVGIPDDEWGEQVMAVVELREGRTPSPQLAAEIVAFCRQRLAAYKCPRRVEFVERLPRSEAGKVLRSKVRERYLA